MINVVNLARIEPYPRSELRSQLARNAITRATLVWQLGYRRWRAPQVFANEPARFGQKCLQSWVAAALGLTLLCGGIAAVHTQNTKIATSEFAGLNHYDADLSNHGPRRYRLSDTQVAIAREVGEGAIIMGSVKQDLWGTLSFSDIDFMFNSVRPSPKSQTSIAIPAAAEGRLVQEFWRSMVSSDVAERYVSYLRNYPSGEFAGVATARITELRKVDKEVSVHTDKVGATKKKNGSFTKTKQSRTSEKTSAVKTSTRKRAVRCRDRYTDRCRELLRSSEKDCVDHAIKTRTSKACITRNYRSKIGLSG
jgi:hypothetical protein